MNCRYWLLLIGVAVGSLSSAVPVRDAWAQAAEPARLDRSARARFAGTYVFPGGRRAAISLYDSSLVFTESRDGRGGTFVPTSDSTLVAGRTLDAESPIDIRVTLTADHQRRVTGLRWSQADGAPQLARRAALAEQNVRYPSGAISLEGTLITPTDAGRHPAIVFVTGAGPALRNQFGALPHLVASYGIAVLIYDKRGCGASTGTYADWLPLDTLALDALAGVRHLAARPDIGASRIGMLGVSQGGWVVPLAASRSREVAFMVLKSASSLPTWENNLHEVDNGLRLAGFPEGSIVRAHRAGELFNAMVRAHGERAAWSELRDTLLAIRYEPWFDAARLPDSLPPEPAPANLRWVEREFRSGFDPRPLWETMKHPVLVMNGGLDENVPGPQSAEWFSASLRRAGNRDFKVRVFPSADHWGWEVSRLGQREGRSRQLGVHEMTTWIARHAGRPADGSP